MKKFILFGTPLLLAGCTVSIDNPAAFRAIAKSYKQTYNVGDHDLFDCFYASESRMRKEFGWEVSHPAFMGARGTLEIRFNRIARDKTEISILTQDNQSFISLEKWQQIADRCGQSETTLSRT